MAMTRWAAGGEQDEFGFASTRHGLPVSEFGWPGSANDIGES